MSFIERFLLLCSFIEWLLLEFLYTARREPKFKTTANEAYNVVKEMEEEGGTGDGYETPHHHLDSVLSTSTDVIASVEDSIYEN